MICFIDMDGVVADFVGAACKAHNRSWPYDDPKNRGKFEIEPAWGITPKEFWAPIDALGVDFWLNLEKTPEADKIISRAISAYGVHNICMLTSPSDDPGCVPGKRGWMRKHYPNLAKSMLFGSAKQFLSGPKRVLIDDRDKNIDDFIAYGGTGILVPRPWNIGHVYVNPLVSVFRGIEESVRRD